MSHLHKFLPALSLAILAFQIYIPWSVPHLVTQDGPAHVYTAFVTKDLLFHRRVSPYHEVYRVQKSALPNWTGTLILAGFLSVFGPDRAEAFLMTICLLAGYAALAYCAGVLSAGKTTPLIMGNWLIQSWFLWAGFYNFYLGMALLMAMVGFFIRHERELSWRRAAAVAGGLVFIFFTHLIAAVLAAISLFAIGIWMRRSGSALGKLALAIAPTAALVILYAARFKGTDAFRVDVLAAWLKFPEKIFVFCSGWVGEQRILWPAVLCFIVTALASMRRREWRSARGAMAAMTGLAFLLYSVVPDLGFGGSVVKMRFAWAVFLFGGMLMVSVERLRKFQTAIGMFVGALLLAQLWLIAGQVRQTSEAAGIYLAAMDRIPLGSRFVRLHYPAPSAASRFRTNRLDFDPLLHLDALGAVRRHAVDLSDYQSATGTFSVAFKPAFDEGQRGTLWSLENPEAGTWAGLDWVRGGIPVSIDYAVIFGDRAPGEIESRATAVTDYSDDDFVRVYLLNRVVR